MERHHGPRRRQFSIGDDEHTPPPPPPRRHCEVTRPPPRAGPEWRLPPRIAWVVAVLMLLMIPVVDAKQLIVLVQPITSIAGEPLPTQPIVALTDDDGNILTGINDGTVRAQIGVNPSRFATVQPAANSFSFVNGIAKCTDLFINKVDRGYTLVLVSLSHGVRAETASFDVVTGSPYTIAISADISTAYGGTPFLPQPQASIVDKGGNVVSGQSQGTVSLEIVDNPTGGQLLPLYALRATINAGHAKFSGLYIDVAGSPYTLRYSTDLALPGPRTITTNPFTVAAGVCNSLILLSSPRDATGGKAFGIQPVLKLIDAGGNTLKDDSASSIKVTIASNPSGGSLAPSTSLRARVRNGMAIFRSLRIDKAGTDYTLSFVLYAPGPGADTWLKTDIERISPPFTVAIGGPVTLDLRQPLSNGVLDGQPNEIQPQLALLDAGANVAATIMTGTVVASMVQSAAIQSAIVVDTAAAPAVTVVQVRALPPASAAFVSPFGVGMLLSLEVTFSDDVKATGLPRLELASGAASGGANGLADCVTINTWSSTLVFQYSVVATDGTADLDYPSTTALTLNGGTIIDRNGRTPVLTLPTPGAALSLGGTSAVAIDTTAPSIVSVSCSSPGNGEFGSGEELALSVLYTAPVTVYGSPVLPVSLGTIGNGDTVRNALFSSGNNTDTLVFLYTVQTGDATAPGGVLDVTAPITLPTGSYIKRHSTRPTTDVVAAMVTAPKNLGTLQAITIDTAIPMVDTSVGVTSRTSNGVYTPGDVLEIVVTFTKPVQVTGFPRLYLETGSIKRPAGYVSGDGTTSLVFAYKVAAYDSHSATGNAALNYRDDDAIDLNGGTIRRLLRRGTQAADALLSLAATTANARGLKDTAQLTLDGLPAVVTSVAVTSAPGTTVTRGDVVQITISFSSRVTVDTTNGRPSLGLDIGDNDRRATYKSGTGTQALVFEYTIALGDRSATGLEYRNTRALSLNGGTIRKTSAAPVMDADLTLPTPAMSTVNPIIVDRAMGFVTTVTGLTADVPAGEYGLNQVISFSVTFSDEVAVDGQPVLKLNSGLDVPYITGSATKSLVFMHIVPAGEYSAGLDKVDDQALVCAAPCKIINYNAELATLSLTGITLQPPGIVIDTQAPRVVAVYAVTPTTAVNGGVFVVGDVIEIVVEMSLEVFVEPPTDAYPEKAPLLLLDTNAMGHDVLCVGFYQGDRHKLLFRYTVAEGDWTSDLSYVDVDSLTLNNNQCAIRRFSTSPTTDAVLTLPAPAPLGAPQHQVLRVDSTIVPTVLRVTATNADGLYRCGDQLELTVTFSQHVVVTGRPFLWLDLGAASRRALYAGGSGTTTLSFTYVVEEGDYTVDLEYIDHHSLDASGTGDAILHLATHPTTVANVDLPYPYTQDSLGATKDLRINGRKPNILGTRFVTVDGVYGVNDQVVLELTFSSCVVVVPAPLTGAVPAVKFQPSPLGTTTIITRYAPYVGGSPGSALRFEYTIRTGDASLDLDYADAQSLVLNGAQILTCTSDLARFPPVQAVETHLNPPGGRLLGDTAKVITFGQVAFTDLLVDRLGFDYEILYRTTVGTATLEARNRFDVLYSSNFGLRSTPYASGDALGTSVDVDKDTLVLGAPGAQEPVSAVQIVSVVGDAKDYVDEIQVLQTTATAQPAVQELTSSAAPGETLGGWFFVKMGSIGPTRRLYYNFDATQLRVALELDLGFGKETIRVSRQENTYCACSNGFVWTITFLYVAGPLPPLTVSSSALTGRLATVGDGRGGNAARILVESTAIAGFFTLQSGGRVSRNVKYNVGEDELATILTQDLQLPVRQILRSLPSTVRGYEWSITFAASELRYDVPPLGVNGIGLQGFEARCVVRTLREGLGRVSGFFRLRFRNDLFPADETVDLAVTASDHDIEAALENLVSINDVGVTRSTAMNAFGGYAWTITFRKVNTRNDYGPVLDTSGNLPALVAVTSTTPPGATTPVALLKGTNARVLVQIGGYAMPPLLDGETHWGLPGTGAGAVAVFVRAENDWKQQGGTLAAPDTRAGDRFGSSVSLRGDRVLVGAPAAAIFGDAEIQNLVCDADGGYLRVAYRGRASEPLAFNADAAALRAAIVGVMSVGYADVEILTTFTTLCQATEISIALHSGDHGDNAGNVLDLTVDPTRLTKSNGLLPGTATIREYRRGTFRTDGVDAKGIQVGAAYTFVRNPVTRTWALELKFTPPTDPPAALAAIREYGAAVALLDSFAVIGAPGAEEEEGRVFVYQRNLGTGQWALFQVLTAAPYAADPGDRFGESVAISGNPLATLTIAVGAPGYAASRGAVFVFDLDQGKFQNRQLLVQVTPELGLGDRFGTSLDLDMLTTFTLVVGADRSAFAAGRDSGLALVFVRRSAGDTFFALQQLLVGSDTRARDRFGRTVAVSRHTIIVGAHEDYNGPRTIRKPAQAVTIDAPASTRIVGGTFTLRLRKATSTPSTIPGNTTVTEDVGVVTTSALPWDITAAALRVRLESEFPFLGKILVTREGPKATTQGSTWSVTFAGSSADVPLLELDDRGLRLADATQSPISRVRWIVRVPPVLRGNAYVFTRGATGRWTEQATLYPREKQYFSWLGTAVALDARTAILGAPNLDTYETGINAGGGFVYDLGLLSLGFTAKTYAVDEGGDVDIPVQRCSRPGGGAFCAMDVAQSPRLFINYDTGDAFSDVRGRNFVGLSPHVGPFGRLTQLDARGPSDPTAFYAPDVRGQEPWPLVARGRWLRAEQVGTATGRNQYYGSTDRRSLWVDATFDYAGVSDYQTSTGELFFDLDTTVQTFRVSTTGDFVFEDPDETVPLRLSLPGIWPSFDGNLWATLTIRDNGDGGSGTRASLDALTAGQNPRMHQSESDFASAVAVYHDGNVAIVGAPRETQVLANRDAPVRCGAAHIYIRRSGFWEFETRLVPAECDDGLRFGSSVAIDGLLGTIRVIVGAPGIVSAYVYRRQAAGNWVLESRLADPTGSVTQPTAAFGGPHAVGLAGDVAVIGASGAESIFVYHRTTNGWEFVRRLYCSDRRVYRILEQDVEPRYGFGSVLAIHRRTIAVGAPTSDAGAFVNAQYQDQGFDRAFFGKGAVYLFHIQAQEQTVALRTDDPLSRGTFQLATTYRGLTGTTKPLSFAATPEGMRVALEELVGLRLVEVTRKGTIDQGFTWSITFLGAILPVPVLTAQWLGNGCADCDAFNSQYKADPANQIFVQEVTPLGSWAEQARVLAPDGNPGDRFGGSVALSGEQLIVGAEGSGALATTTWDFETGDLTGWLTTGTAFDTQPTYGDNSYARINVYRFRHKGNEAPGQRALHEGRYWIGTFENRRGASKVTAQVTACAFASDALCNLADYRLPGPEPAGNYQGDGPQGTLTSQAFTILGPTLTFKLGGGCDIRVIYVELLVDGISVMKDTGQCEESMADVTWDLRPFFNRTAQLRVVDASSSDYWGHINFDHVRFSWDVAQATTPHAGAAYAFRRKAPGSQDPCVNINHQLCDWEFQARLIASDKQTDDRFGWDVAVDDTTGLAAVSAPGQRAVDANNSILLDPHTLQALDGVGSVYIFKRSDEVRDGKGILVSPPKWSPKETAKLQFPKHQAQARFGHGLALDQTTLLAGAPGFATTLLKPKAGQVFAYDSAFAFVQFTSNLFYCVEGNTDGIVSLTIHRTGGNFSQPLTIGYATEDLNAYAIDSLKYAACMRIPTTQRRDCFDYLQGAGELTFAAGETSKQIIIKIVDDTCLESKPEFFVVRLNVPGGEALIGEQHIARVRIDDDDWTSDPC